MTPASTRGLPRRHLLAMAAAVVALGAVTGCSPPSPASVPPAPKAAFKGVDITGADYARTLSLKDVDGRVRSLEEFRGKAVVVFFGFTQCPDVCPTTLAEVAQARALLGADGARVQPVFVTVDPERDTPAVLKSYVASFGPDVIALHGTPDEVKAAARDFKVFFMKVPGKTESTYTIDHTAAAYVFDTKGQVRLFVRYGSGPQALADDLRTLLAEAPRPG